MNRRLLLLIIVTVVLLGGVALFSSGTFGTQALWSVSKEGSWLLPLVAVSAAIDSVNPCAFSILLVTIAFLFSLNAVRRKILAVGGAYVGGIFLVYLLIGLGILQTLHLFNTPHFMAKVGASVLIIFGVINLINEFFPAVAQAVAGRPVAFPIKLGIPHVAHQKIADLMNKASIPTAFALGVLVGLCEFPCTGGPYLMVLGLLHDSATFGKGLLYLLFYNVIFVLPLALILLIASEKSVHGKIEDWKRKNMRMVRRVAGVAMVVLGMIIFLL